MGWEGPACARRESVPVGGSQKGHASLSVSGQPRATPPRPLRYWRAVRCLGVKHAPGMVIMSTMAVEDICSRERVVRGRGSSVDAATLAALVWRHATRFWCVRLAGGGQARRAGVPRARVRQRARRVALRRYAQSKPCRLRVHARVSNTQASGLHERASLLAQRQARACVDASSVARPRPVLVGKQVVVGATAAVGRTCRHRWCGCHRARSTVHAKGPCLALWHLCRANQRGHFRRVPPRFGRLAAALGCCSTGPVPAPSPEPVARSSGAFPATHPASASHTPPGTHRHAKHAAPRRDGWKRNTLRAYEAGGWSGQRTGALQHVSLTPCAVQLCSSPPAAPSPSQRPSLRACASRG